MTGVSRIIVFGGNGFVGSAIIAAALKRPGVEKIIGVCRSGALNSEMHGLTKVPGYNDKVEWMKGDISQLGSSKSAKAAQEWEGEVAENTGVISCVGMFDTSNDVMRNMNGGANKCLVEVAKRSKAAHMVYISAYEVENDLPFRVIPGYFEGKRIAEEAVHQEFGEHGAILQPGMVYGTRVHNGLSIPLGLLGAPLEALFTLPGLDQLQHKLPVIGKLVCSPPVSVHHVAQTAVMAATGELLGEEDRARVLSIDDIRRVGS
jgi:nucleoside-diphosphate-sugar epimerase